MIVLCPSCKTRYRLDETKIGDAGVRLRCTKCNTLFRVAKPKAAPAPAPAAQPAPAPAVAKAPPAAAPPSPNVITGPFKPAGQPKASIIVGDTDEAYLKHLVDLLVAEGFQAFKGRNGKVVMQFIRQRKPEVAIVDVALSGMFGFQIAENIRADAVLAEKVKVILIVSVYEKERFRREPQSLYGADAYVEKHHDGPEILKKVNSLLFPPPPEPEEQAVPPAPEITQPQPTPAPTPEPQPAQAPQPPAPAPAPQPQAPQPQAPAPTPTAAPPSAPQEFPDDPDHQKAQRLARTIVSDISLYNPDLIVQGVKEGNLKELLAKDIADGRNHYERKVAPEIRSQFDYLDVALNQLIERKKQELGLA